MGTGGGVEGKIEDRAVMEVLIILFPPDPIDKEVPEERILEDPKTLDLGVGMTNPDV